MAANNAIPAWKWGVTAVALAIGYYIAQMPPPVHLTTKSMWGLGIFTFFVIVSMLDTLPDYVGWLLMCTCWYAFSCVKFEQAFGFFRQSHLVVGGGGHGAGLGHRPVRSAQAHHPEHHDQVPGDLQRAVPVPHGCRRHRKPPDSLGHGEMLADGPPDRGRERPDGLRTPQQRRPGPVQRHVHSRRRDDPGHAQRLVHQLRYPGHTARCDEDVLGRLVAGNCPVDRPDPGGGLFRHPHTAPGGRFAHCGDQRSPAEAARRLGTHDSRGEDHSRGADR